MKEAVIDRFHSVGRGVLSRIHLPSKTMVYGVERPWLNNAPNISCFPAGSYVLMPWRSPSKGRCLIFLGGTLSTEPDDVPKYAVRWGCLMHPANLPTEVQGCMAPGLRYSLGKDANGMPSVIDSRKAMRIVMDDIDEPVMCHVRWRN